MPNRYQLPLLWASGNPLSGLSVQIHSTIIDTWSTNAIGGLGFIPLFRQALFRGGILTRASSMFRDIMCSGHRQGAHNNQPAGDPLTRGNAWHQAQECSVKHAVHQSTGTTPNWATPRQRQRANNCCKDTKSTPNSTVRSVTGYVAAHRSQENQTETENSLKTMHNAVSSFVAQDIQHCLHERRAQSAQSHEGGSVCVWARRPFVQLRQCLSEGQH